MKKFLAIPVAIIAAYYAVDRWIEHVAYSGKRL
jgi:hypothetical protein